METLLFILRNAFFSKNYWLLIFVFGLILATVNPVYTQTIKEKKTGIEFSQKLELAGKKYDYVTSGSIQASFVFTFDVCAFAFYVEEGKLDKNKNPIDQLFEDGPSKYLVINFVRGVKAKDIRDAYEEGFKKIVTNYNTPKAKQVIEPFLNALIDVNKNEKMEYTWSAGGNIELTIKGQKKHSFQNVGFAKALWAIYLQ